MRRFIFIAAFISSALIAALIVFLIQRNEPVGQHLGDILTSISENSKPITYTNELATDLKLYEGKKVVCFFSLKCVYCLKVAKQLTVFSEKNEYMDDIFVFFAGREINVNWFFNKAESSHFEYKMLEKEVLSQLTDGVVPKIFLIEDGIVQEILDYEDVNEQKFKSFFGK
jgi:hypothetical protein